MYVLGYDIGTSSVKASLVEIATGRCAASAFYPEAEAPILSIKNGWAEQDPEMWWDNLKLATRKVLSLAGCKGEAVQAIGISYQMHGLVCVDREGKALRPSIIWCDGRAVPYGRAAYEAIGAERCLTHLLNSPGNFTAAKLAWVKENEPELFEKIDTIMLPGDYIAMRLSGGVRNTTLSGLSEGIFWDFAENRISRDVLEYFGFSESIIAPVVPTFSVASAVCPTVAEELGLAAGTPISYRAGDQPNNALSLNVMRPGEVAATGGTSGVVYGVLNKVNYDPLSRVNTFAHVNHTPEHTRLGVLLCINGTGILNAWVKRTIAPEGTSYAEMNRLAAEVSIGSDGLCIIPFGNGAERILENADIGASIHGLNFNRHSRHHIMRAAQEGIVFSFVYGMEIMQQMGMNLGTIKAGKANMFLSPVFLETLAGTADTSIELYETDGAAGAAKGAGIGAGIYANADEAFATLQKLDVIQPDIKHTIEYRDAYERWKEILESTTKKTPTSETKNSINL
jgi:xylulokinase